MYVNECLYESQYESEYEYESDIPIIVEACFIWLS